MKKWLLPLLSLLIALAGVIAKNVYESNREFNFAKGLLESRSFHRQGLQANYFHWFVYRSDVFKQLQMGMERGLALQGVKHLRRSLAWNPYHKQAENLLWGLAEEAELSGDGVLATRIYLEIRSAFVSTSIFSGGQGAKVMEVNNRLARLGDVPESMVNVTPSPGEKMTPNWKMLGSVFAWVWILSVFLFIFKSGIFENKKRREWGYFIASFLIMCLWVFSLAKAGP